MLVLAFMAYTPVVHATTVWKDPTGLGPLAGSDATGRRVPVIADDVIDGSFPVATSSTPTLTWKHVPTDTSQVEFRIVTLQAQNPTTVWSATVAVSSTHTAQVRVGSSVLKQGHTYGWVASTVGTPSVTHGPFNLTIDMQRASVQQLSSFAGVSVAENTGELVYAWNGPALSTLSGGASWTLINRPTNTNELGLPTG